MLHNTSERWGSLQQTLHWLVVALVLAQLFIGMTLARTPGTDPGWLELYPYHATIGVSILIAMVVRLWWRLRNPVPELPDTLTHGQKQLAHATHWLLYATLIAMPIVGWAMISAFGQQTVVFGIPLPHIVGENTELARELKTWHSAGAAVLAGLLTLHITGALRHGYVLKDGVLHRMAPFLEKAHGDLPVGQRLDPNTPVVGKHGTGSPSASTPAEEAQPEQQQPSHPPESGTPGPAH